MANYKVVDADKLDADLAQVADAVRSKSGKAESLTFPSGFIQSVHAISNGVDTSSDTVTADTLSEGITAHDAAGTKITGTVKHRFFQGEIVSTVIGLDAYAVLCNDPIIAEHFYDPNLWIKVRFDIAPTPYTVIETWGFNTSGTNMDLVNRIGQAVMRYNRSGDMNSNVMGIAINGVDGIGAAAGVGQIKITQTGEVRIYSKSSNFAIRPSKYTVEVNWNA